MQHDSFCGIQSTQKTRWSTEIAVSTSLICPFCPAPGKCSHGGAADLTSAAIPRGGISKDERRADNVAFHNAAVTLATAASLQLLEDIRSAAGDKDFLRCAFQISNL